MTTRLARLIVLVALLGSVSTTGAGAETGIDTSRWQHPNGAPIDWQAVKNSGRSFVFIKATGGPSGGQPTTADPYFAADRAAAGAVGLLRGAYHYAQPGLPIASNALEQARSFVAVTGSMQGSLDLPPALDVETSNGLSPAQMVAWIHTWLDEVERLTGRRPLIYTGLSFWNTAVGGSSEFSGYRLWFARYVPGVSPGPLPNGFATWTFWQQSNTGSVPGIAAAVDLDNFCCTGATLTSLTGTGTGNGGSPFGWLDIAVGGPDGTISAAGWSIDPDVVGPIGTHVYVDGVGYDVGATLGDRSDLANFGYGQFGAQHGFSFGRAGYAPGVHEVCVFAINQSYGNNTLLECRKVLVPGGSPVGVVDAVTTGPDGAVRVSGWSFDPDVSGPLQTHVYVDGVGTNLGATTGSRPDVVAGLPAYSPSRGFEWTTSGLAPGRHSVCVFAINQGLGTNTLLRCATATVPGGNPFGSVDQIVATAGRTVTVSGWVVDPDTAAPVAVHVYVDGAGTNLGPAGALRPDVAAAVAGYGAAHGYAWTSPSLAPGAHSVCVFGINAGAGANTLFACRNVTV